MAALLSRVRAAPFTALCSRLASSAAAPLLPPLAPALQAAVASHPLVVYHKSHCSYCRDLLERLDDAEIPVHAVALDKLGAF